MKPQKQKYLHCPEEGQYGDCYRTCLACLLDLDRDDVPHFVDTMDPGEWERSVQPRVDAWLRERGFVELALPATGDCDLDTILQLISSRGVYTILTGTSATGCNHCVIVGPDRSIHDPGRDNPGIVGPADDGFWWLSVLVPVQMAHQAPARTEEVGL
ncbi:MAG: hypothetical protein KDI33_08770 [Halioglobus sp.]|nr:hypothetical protein [Halioglobus sp.]